MHIKRTDSNTHEQTSTERGMRPLKFHRLSTRMDQLRDSHNDLANQVSELKGSAMVIGLVFLAISIVFAVLSGLAGYKIYVLEEREATLHGYHDQLVDQFQQKLEQIINRLIFVNPADKQHFMLQELAKMMEGLNRFNINSEEFDNRRALAVATMMVIDNNDAEALKALELLKKRTAHTDPFVFARASALHAILLVRPTRTCENPAIKPLLEEAVKRDPGLAAAYNLLGLCLTEEAVAIAKSQSDEDWPNALKAIQEAFVYYDLSFALQPSPWARSKSLNNKVWSTLVLFESVLENENRIAQFLALNKHADFEQFANDSLDRLALCSRLSANPVWSETEAELHGLRSAYYTRTNQPVAAAAAVVQMKKAYGRAISDGLYSTRRRREEAIDYFKSDTLLKTLHNDREILQAIEKSVTPAM